MFGLCDLFGICSLLIFFSLGFVLHEFHIFFPMIYIIIRRNKASIAYGIKELSTAGTAGTRGISWTMIPLLRYLQKLSGQDWEESLQDQVEINYL